LQLRCLNSLNSDVPALVVFRDVYIADYSLYIMGA